MVFVAAIIAVAIVAQFPSLLRTSTAPMITPAAENTTTAAHTSTNLSDISPRSANQRWLNLSTRVYLIAISGAALIGAVGILASFFIYFYSARVGEEQAAATLRLQTTGDLARAEAATANERTKALEAHTAELQQKTAGAQAEAAQANARAETARTEQARLTVELEQEHVERLRFQAQFAWRIIYPAQAMQLIETLSASPGAVNIEFFAGDAEATFLALQLERIFIAAKWKVGLSSKSYGSAVFFGVFVPPSDEAERNEVLAALRAAGIEPSVAQLPSSSFGFVAPHLPGPVIGIGSKPFPGIEELGKILEGFLPPADKPLGPK